jgi:2'-5' RNA ligase
VTRATAQSRPISGRWRTLRARAARVLRRDGSALIAPIPWAEPIVDRWRAMYDGSAADGMPAHITVLYPFLPSRAIRGSVEAVLRSALAAHLPFHISLTRVERFSGVLYLAPEPSEPFVTLTAAVWARWPDYPPYRGAYRTTVPHLTVATGSEPPGLAEELERCLPVEGEVRDIWLMTKSGEGLWSARHRFPLGGEDADGRG